MNHHKIKTLRESIGLTQKQAAVAAGMNDGRHWSNIERGSQKSKSISVEMLERIAGALGVTAADLLSPVAVKTTPKRATPNRPSKRAKPKCASKTTTTLHSSRPTI